MRREIDATYGKAVRSTSRSSSTQNMHDALTSFVYNLGPGAISPSTGVGRALRACEWERASNEMLRWDKAGGRSLPGLTRRRRAERALFLKDRPRPKPKPASKPRGKKPVAKRKQLSKHFNVSEFDCRNGTKVPRRDHDGLQLPVPRVPRAAPQEVRAGARQLGVPDRDRTTPASAARPGHATCTRKAIRTIRPPTSRARKGRRRIGTGRCGRSDPRSARARAASASTTRSCTSTSVTTRLRGGADESVRPDRAANDRVPRRARTSPAHPVPEPGGRAHDDVSP